MTCFHQHGRGIAEKPQCVTLESNSNHFFHHSQDCMYGMGSSVGTLNFFVLTITTFKRTQISEEVPSLHQPTCEFNGNTFPCVRGSLYYAAAHSLGCPSQRIMARTNVRITVVPDPFFFLFLSRHLERHSLLLADSL